LSYSVSDVASDSITVIVDGLTYVYPPPPATTTTAAASPSQGVTVTSVINDIIYAISVILDAVDQAIRELAPYLISFLAAFTVLSRTYNAVRGVVRRYFGRYLRI
jgi:hypothetical protein